MGQSTDRNATEHRLPCSVPPQRLHTPTSVVLVFLDPGMFSLRALAAVALIPRLLPGPVRLTDVAQQVALSPSRPGRLFNEQVGQSFPTCVRWARLRRAVEALCDGTSLTDAAHVAGFTDSAHANRVCHEMFGMAPSKASRELVWA